VTESGSPFAKMRPRKFVWVASLALALGATSITAIQHSHVVAMSDSRAAPSAPSFPADLGQPIRSTAAESTRSADSLASLSVPPKTGVTATQGSRASLVVKRSTPIHISIPVIGMSAPLVVLGLNKNGSPQVPSSWYVPGWYKYDAAPGQNGTAVILGHIDSVAGPAVFYRVSQLKAGDRVVVKLRDGVTVHFAVIAVREYLKAKFPDRYVYGYRGYPALQLVTCGGAFDYQTHHYLSNIVVFTKMVKQ
jgi:hypothetical protein